LPDVAPGTRHVPWRSVREQAAGYGGSTVRVFVAALTAVGMLLFAGGFELLADRYR